MQYRLVLLIASMFGMTIIEFAKRVLVGVGFTWVTIGGAYLIFDQIKDKVSESTSKLPIAAVQVMGLLQVDVAITMFLSYAAAKLALQGWSKITDTKNTHVWRLPGTGGSQPF